MYMHHHVTKWEFLEEQKNLWVMVYSAEMFSRIAMPVHSLTSNVWWFLLS